MTADRTSQLAPWINLVVPGGGLILLGAQTLGLGVGIAFAGVLNLTLFTRLIIPADFPDSFHRGAILVCCGVYLAAQLALFPVERRRRDADALIARRRRLQEAQRFVNLRRHAEAIAVLDELHAAYPADLGIASRRAQVMMESGHPAAPAALEVVRRLDRHGIYRHTRVEDPR